MSATNRGGQRKAADLYETPPWCVHRLLDKLNLPSGYWLEPGAGSGAIVKAVNDVRDDVDWTAIELLRSNRKKLKRLTNDVVIGDFLQSPSGDGDQFDVVLGNPPYSLAQQFIEQALPISPIVCLLLRVNFLASARRKKFMQKHPPDIYVLPDRPSFTGKGTDATEYAWMVWPGAKQRKYGRVQVLDTTPRKIRLSKH